MKTLTALVLSSFILSVAVHASNDDQEINQTQTVVAPSAPHKPTTYETIKEYLVQLGEWWESVRPTDDELICMDLYMAILP